MPLYLLFFFFFNDTATTEIYTLSLHDALPILLGEATIIDISDFERVDMRVGRVLEAEPFPEARKPAYKLRIDFGKGDRKSTRLNSSHGYISYAVFCLKKKTMHDVTTVTSSVST